MENDAAMLYCPNENCQAPNPLKHNFCQQCRTPLPKRYLWAVGDGSLVGNPGDLLADQYLVISKSILLDTKPGLVSKTPELESLELIKPYLRLIPYRIHIPQVYGILALANGRSKREILLLEKPPLNIDSTGDEVDLCSELSTAWRDASSMRQLNWLWQIAYIWEPLVNEGVASTLFEQDLLRVEGSLVRLLELRLDKHSTPDLNQLGKFWQELVPTAKPAIAEFVNAICHRLCQGEILSGEQLMAILDQGLAQIGQSQTPLIKITTKSDTGPSRQRNEDACYPRSGTTITKPPQQSAIAIVCDGIGGHEGGNVASNLAIETIQQQVQQLAKISFDHIDPVTLVEDLEQAAAIANDKISQLNDSEHRQGRQRMGTTLVMAMPIAHEMYIAHVGDSRAYWITRYGCYQVTLDDDVASREVRLGYAIYRDALQQGASGSLVQALGMSPSSSLHPTVQRFILDEDCVFLLCSDGLSDFDRVEQYWDTEILPIITDRQDITDVTKRLLEIANSQNGHDNVTIALVHYQVKYSEPKLAIKASLSDLPLQPATNSILKKTRIPQETTRSQKTKVLSTGTTAKGSGVPIQLIMLVIVVLGGGLLGYFVRQWWSLTGVKPPFPTPLVTPSISITEDVGSKTQGSLFQTNSPVKLSKVTPPVQEVLAPAGTIFQIINTEPVSGDSSVHLRVCSIGTTSATSNKIFLKSGDEVKIPFSIFKSLKNSLAKGDNPNKCLSSNVTKPRAEQSKIKSTPKPEPISNEVVPQTNVSQPEGTTK